MINDKKLLIEIGTEELPSNEINLLLKLLLINLKLLLKKNKIKNKSIKNFITIRRISFIIDLDLDLDSNENVIKDIIEKILKETQFKTTMRWATYKDKFIRPIIWYILMYGSKIIEHTIFNIKSNCYSITHRINKKKIKVTASNYEMSLKKGHVIIDSKKRFNLIKEQLIKISKQKKIKLIINKEELIKISNSIEYPKTIICQFNKIFLDLPEKIIIINLIEKNCIPIIQKNITNKFIVIADTYINKVKKIKNGYENCINLKLSESSYYYKQTYNFIHTYTLKKLKNITFHEKIGNLYNKIYRMSYILKHSNINNNIKIIKSIILSKLDIQTKIVSEIPNVKGLISAHNLIINKDISKILYEHNKIYNNDIPKSKIASIITLLDNIDNITGFFIIGEKAKNKKDPFNLRRDAIIIIKTIINNKLNIDLKKIIKLSLNSYNISNKNSLNTEVTDFIFDRLKFNNKNKFADVIKNYNVYKKYLISTACYRFNLYKINEEIKSLTKRIHKLKIKNAINNRNKYKRLIDNNAIKVNLIKTLMKQIKITRILYKNNLYFEYIKTMLNLNLCIKNFFTYVFILNENKEIRINNLKIINILDKYLNSLVTFKNIK